MKLSLIILTALFGGRYCNFNDKISTPPPPPPSPVNTLIEESTSSEAENDLEESDESPTVGDTACKACLRVASVAEDQHQKVFAEHFKKIRQYVLEDWMVNKELARGPSEARKRELQNEIEELKSKREDDERGQFCAKSTGFGNQICLCLKAVKLITSFKAQDWILDHSKLKDVGCVQADDFRYGNGTVRSKKLYDVGDYPLKVYLLRCPVKERSTDTFIQQADHFVYLSPMRMKLKLDLKDAFSFAPMFVYVKQEDGFFKVIQCWETDVDELNSQCAIC